MICFSRHDALSGTTTISALVEGSGIVLDLVRGLGSASALAWDKEQTMYVADGIRGDVSAFPVGRVMANAPLTQIAHLPGASGLAVTSSADAWCRSDTVATTNGLKR